jgi:apolipoprotein D and lipocalin family protein
VRVCAAIVFVALAACTVANSNYGLRDASAPISSTTRLDSSRLTGDWYEILYGYVSSDGPRYVYSRIPFIIERVAPEKLNVSYPNATEVDDFEWNGGDLGRFDAVSQNRRRNVWVLWIDEDHQTVVLGNPQGSFAQILNRTPTLRADRLQAAKDILEFNGYDLSQLKMTPQ